MNRNKNNIITITAIDDFIDKNISKSTFKTIGSAFGEFTKEDLLEISAAILKKDISPFLSQVKEESKTIYYGFTLSLKNITKINLTKRKSTILDQKIIFNSESKKRVNQFIKNVYNDFSLLETDEEKGRYLLKVITFTTIFTLIYSPNPGKLTSFSKTPKIKSLLRKSLFPIFMMSSSLVVANRILEQVEKKISDNDEVIQLSEEVRNFITTINAGLNSGLTVQSIAEAFLQSNIRPKEKVDHLVHSALVGLFSKDKA